MTDNKMTEKDLEDLAKLNAEADAAGIPRDFFQVIDGEGNSAEAPPYHPILRVWREVLAPAEDAAGEKVTPQWATRVLGKYVGLSFADMNDVRDLYYELVNDLRKVLDAVIATDPDCLTYGTPEEDVEENAALYFQVLLDWQKTMLQAEMAWDCTSPRAAAQIAAIGEVHGIFFGPTGLTQYLDNIRFEFTEADQAMLQEELTEFRNSQEG